MKPRTLLVLLAVVLGLSAFIWFYERKLPSSEERTEQAKKLLEIEKGEVTAVTIRSPKAGTVQLQRSAPPKPAKAAKQEKEAGEDEEPAVEPAAEWRLTRPVAARADTFAVERLLDSVAALEKTRTLDAVDRHDVGLDKPRATLRLKTKEGETVLQLGAEVPPGGSLVAALAGEKGAYVVSDSILSDVDRPPDDWRDKVMFRGDREAVQRITLTPGAGAAGGPVVLARRRNGFWIERPIVDRADADLVDGLLSDLTGLTAERFVTGSRPPAELGLAPPHEVVDVVSQGVAAPVRVELGAAVTGAAAPEGQTSGELSYARVGTTAFEVRTRLGESARRPPADWRALQLSALAVHEVESAAVQEGGRAMQLTRSGTDWKRDGTLVSYLPVSDFLFAVTGARADRLLTPREAQALGVDLAKPSLTVTLRSQDAGPETLTFYPALGDGAVPAKASGRDVVLRLTAEAFRGVREKLGELRKAKAEK